MSKDVVNVRRRAFLGASAAVLSGAVISGRASLATTGAMHEAGTVKMPAVRYTNDTFAPYNERRTDFIFCKRPASARARA